MATPPLPRPAASRIHATGKCFCSSHASAFGPSLSAAKAAAMSRIAIWSSLRAKGVTPSNPSDGRLAFRTRSL